MSSGEAGSGGPEMQDSWQKIAEEAKTRITEAQKRQKAIEAERDATEVKTKADFEELNSLSKWAAVLLLQQKSVETSIFNGEKEMVAETRRRGLFGIKTETVWSMRSSAAVKGWGLKYGSAWPELGVMLGVDGILRQYWPRSTLKFDITVAKYYPWVPEKIMELLAENHAI